MLTKYSLFLLIAIYFVFSYPVVTTTWNLNYSLGWDKRDWKTFLLPIWFILVFVTYKKISMQGSEISNLFFWSHVLLAVIPTFYFNHPFIKIFNEGASVEDNFSGMIRNYRIFLMYLAIQVIFYILLLVKLFKK